MRTSATQLNPSTGSVITIGSNGGKHIDTYLPSLSCSNNRKPACDDCKSQARPVLPHLNRYCRARLCQRISKKGTANRAVLSALSPTMRGRRGTSHLPSLRRNSVKRQRRQGRLSGVYSAVLQSDYHYGLSESISAEATAIGDVLSPQRTLGGDSGLDGSE